MSHIPTRIVITWISVAIISRVPIEFQIAILSVVKIAIKLSSCVFTGFFFFFIRRICGVNPSSTATSKRYLPDLCQYLWISLKIFIWNRQRKRSLPACGAAVKLHFIERQRAAEKPPEKGSAPGSRGGTSPPRSPTGAFAPWTPYPLSATSSLLR